MDDWYVISNVDRIDSPALAFYPDRISGNIELAKRIIGDTNRLRPHVKTNKAAEVSRMLLDAGIRKFKCATIAEAEMLGHMNAPDVLLAYQPVGPKISRLLDLIKAYPATHYSCLVDQAENARAISALCEAGNITLDVFIDLNVGMNRTGVLPERAEALVDAILPLRSLRIIGLHGYDGHIHDAELSVRCQGADAAYALTERVFREISRKFAYPLVKVMGGTPSLGKSFAPCVFLEPSGGETYLPERGASGLGSPRQSALSIRFRILWHSRSYLSYGRFIRQGLCDQGS